MFNKKINKKVSALRAEVDILNSLINHMSSEMQENERLRDTLKLTAGNTHWSAWSDCPECKATKALL